MEILPLLVIISAFVILPLTSGYIVRYVLQYETNRDLSRELDQDTIDTN